MTSINTGMSGGYYQLNSSNSNNAGNSGQANRSGNATLATLLSATGGQQPANNSAYLLDLSPEAQKYLAGSQQSAASTYLSGGGQQSFTLSSKQQAQIAEIIAKYKDAPFTQETYNKIQDELNARGVGANQLAMIDKATSFNPTQILVGALTGKGTQNDDADGSKAQAKVNNFMQQIVSQWKNISTTAGDVAEPVEEGTGDTVAAAGGTAES